MFYLGIAVYSILRMTETWQLQHRAASICPRRYPELCHIRALRLDAFARRVADFSTSDRPQVLREYRPRDTR
jgi:hypothetical protein